MLLCERRLLLPGAIDDEAAAEKVREAREPVVERERVLVNLDAVRLEARRVRERAQRLRVNDGRARVGDYIIPVSALTGTRPRKGLLLWLKRPLTWCTRWLIWSNDTASMSRC